MKTIGSQTNPSRSLSHMAYFTSQLQKVSIIVLQRPAIALSGMDDGDCALSASEFARLRAWGGSFVLIYALFLAWYGICRKSQCSISYRPCQSLKFQSPGMKSRNVFMFISFLVLLRVHLVRSACSGHMIYAWLNCLGNAAQEAGSLAIDLEVFCEQQLACQQTIIHEAVLRHDVNGRLFPVPPNASELDDFWMRAPRGIMQSD
jgi:hypothetical protein